MSGGQVESRSFRAAWVRQLPSCDSENLLPEVEEQPARAARATNHTPRPHPCLSMTTPVCGHEGQSGPHLPVSVRKTLTVESTLTGRVHPPPPPSPPPPRGERGEPEGAVQAYRRPFWSPLSPGGRGG